MSAFAGILRLDRSHVDVAQVERMAGAAGGRNGEADGSYGSPGGQLGLAARRLTGAEPAQPLANETHDVWLALDGEIYNHRALRHGLELDGHHFRAGAGAEVALHGYEQWGLDFLGHLQGDFTLALWDDRRDRLVLARDRLGRKPLYFAELGCSLSFASGMGALAEALPGPRRLDAEGLAQFLALGHVLPPRTLVAGINKLAPGEMLVADRDGPPYRQRWSHGPIEDRRAAAIRAQATERHVGNIRTLIECSVADRLMGEFRVGALIGPGLDGGVAAAIMGRLTGRPVAAVTVVDAGAPDGAAARDARLLARAARAEVHEIGAGAGDTAASLPDLVRSMGEPLGDPGSVLSWWAGKGCAQAGLGSVLTGEGADEVLLGHAAYGRADRFPLGQRLRRLFARLAGRPLATQRPAAPVHPLPGWEALLSPETTAAALPPDPSDHLRRAELPPWLSADPLAAAGWLDLTGRLAESACPRLDAMAAAHGVAARLPFLDESLVAYAVAVPGRCRAPGGAPKQLWRRAIVDLIPSELSRRTVTPVSLPLGAWLAEGPLSAALGDAFAGSGLFRHGVLSAASAEAMLAAHRAGGEWTRPLWSMLVLAEWYDLNQIEGVAPRDSEWGAALPLTQNR